MSNCIVCESNNIRKQKIHFKEDNEAIFFEVIICKQCGHGYRQDIGFRQNLQNQSQYFDKKVAPPSKGYWPKRLAIITSKIQKKFPNGGKILDIGCSTGALLCCFGNNWSKYGVDISPTCTKIAQEFAQAEVYCGAIEDYTPSHRFDVITAFALIEHLHDPCSFVKYIYKTLVPGGIAVIMTGDRESKIALQFKEKWPLYLTNKHLHFFSHRSLNYILKKSGFHILRREWLCMSYSKQSFFQYFIAKILEINGLCVAPIYDHLYIYAEKQD